MKTAENEEGYVSFIEEYSSVLEKFGLNPRAHCLQIGAGSTFTFTGAHSGTIRLREPVFSALALFRVGHRHPEALRAHHVFIHEVLHSAGPTIEQDQIGFWRPVEEVVTELAARSFTLETEFHFAWGYRELCDAVVDLTVRITGCSKAQALIAACAAAKKIKSSEGSKRSYQILQLLATFVADELGKPLSPAEFADGLLEEFSSWLTTHDDNGFAR